MINVWTRVLAVQTEKGLELGNTMQEEDTSYGHGIDVCIYVCAELGFYSGSFKIFSQNKEYMLTL